MKIELEKLDVMKSLDLENFDLFNILRPVGRSPPSLLPPQEPPATSGRGVVIALRSSAFSAAFALVAGGCSGWQWVEGGCFFH